MWLAHAKLSKAERAYIAADLYFGDARLVEPTMLQSASLARVNVTYAHIAASRPADRLLVEGGIVSLAPKPIVKALPAPVSVEQRLVSVINDVGIKGARDLLDELAVFVEVRAMEQEQLAAVTQLSTGSTVVLAEMRAPPSPLTPNDFHIATGHTVRHQTEIVLLARRGNCRRRRKDVRELILALRREHSRKPDEFYRRVEAYCEGPYVDLFAREQRSGWATWGDQKDFFNAD